MKRKPKRKKYFGMHLYPQWRRGTRLITKSVEATGIPAAYSSTVAWFAERLILLAVVIAAGAFSAGILFDIYLSAPIAESQTYSLLAVTAKAATEQIIDLTSPIFEKFLADNHEPSIDPVAAALAAREQELKIYLSSKGSPLAADETALAALASAKNMKMIVAISFVESDFGKHCYYYNC